MERCLDALQQLRGELLELRPGELLVEVDGAVLGHRQVLQRDARARGAGQLLLRLLGGLIEPLHGDLVLGQVDTGRHLHLGEQMVDDGGVPVVAAEAVVPAGGADLDRGEAVLVLADLQQGDVERTAAEVEDEDVLVLLALLQPVGEGGRGGLVDDAQHVEACDLTGLLGGLTLGVVEVRRDGDDRVRDGVAEVGLRVALELLQHAGADLLRRVLLVVDRRRPVGAHVPLDAADGAVDVGDGLPLGDLSDEHVAVLRERDHRRGGPPALGVGDDARLATLEDCDDGVGGAEVDAYCSCHYDGSPLCRGLDVPESRFCLEPLSVKSKDRLLEPLRLKSVAHLCRGRSPGTLGPCR